MREASKAALRRAKEPATWNKVFQGYGLDIGPGDDPCNLAVPWNISQLEKFDFAQGDANFIRQHFEDQSFDFIHSSHSLEHMRRHPWYCAMDWACLLKTGGYLVITVPDFEMYEKKIWPSRSNTDHKWAFFTEPVYQMPWVLKMEEIVPYLEMAGMSVIHVKRLTDGWDPTNLSDQTISFEDGIECAWEILAIKTKHINFKTPISIQRQNALGDTVVVSALYNHLSSRHDVTFHTSEQYTEYHKGVKTSSIASGSIDINLDSLDEANPEIPIHLLGFLLARIPIPDKAKPQIFISDEEKEEILKTSYKKYVIIDNSSILLASRSVRFEVNVITQYLKDKGIEVIELEKMEPRALIKLIASAMMLIGRDSGAVQIAQAVNTPFIGFMSSVKGHLRYVNSNNNITLNNPCPINEDGCYHKNWYHKDCPIPNAGVAPCGIIDTPKIIKSIDSLLNIKINNYEN
jgi:predicted SAM-dependent methyltransferase